MEGLVQNNTLYGIYWTRGKKYNRRNHTEKYSEVGILEKNFERDDAEILRSITITDNQFISNDI